MNSTLSGKTLSANDMEDADNTFPSPFGVSPNQGLDPYQHRYKQDVPGASEVPNRINRDICIAGPKKIEIGHYIRKVAKSCHRLRN